MPTPRIIFVPGLKPKPPPAPHKRELLRTMIAGLAYTQPAAARWLRDHPDRFTLVSWTHRFYGRYRDVALDLPGIERILEQPEPTAEDIREIDSLARRVRRLWHLLGDALPFFGRLVARDALRLTISDVLRYFGDEGGIGSEIRDLLKEVLRQAWMADERVLLIGHSLGSVIAYDALWELSREEGDARRVEVFLTLGSPLATRFIRRSLRGADRSGAERFPANIARWVNVTAKGEMTALRPMQPYFSPMKALGLIERIDDIGGLYNPYRGRNGLNVHMSYGYLIHADVAAYIGEWLLDERGAAGESAPTSGDAALPGSDSAAGPGDAVERRGTTG